MASVFLSYDRDDAEAAKYIAGALEKAGHRVWWDRWIRGGSEFSEEIERALDDADSVVVLWSRQSVKSPWVRDEAAAGRDKGCLVPAIIEPVQPPLGFRQYQCVDLTGRLHGASHDGLAALAEAIHARAPASARSMAPVVRRTSARRKISKRWIGLAVGLLLTLILAGLLWRTLAPPGAQLVSVAAANAQSRQLARAILVQLASLPSAQSGSVKLIDGSSTDRKPNLIFQAAAVGPTSGSLTFISRRDGSILWSRQFAASDVDLAQRQSVAAAKVLECAIDALTPRAARVTREVLKMYLDACSAMADLGWEAGPVVASLRHVTKAAPKFSAGWAKLLIAETHSLIVSEDRSPAAMAQLRADIIAARKADPQLAEASVAEAMILPMPPIAPVIALVDRAKSQNPNSETVLSEHSLLMQMVGRAREATEDARQVTELDPLSAEARSDYILTLAYADQIAEARQQLALAKRKWPDAKTLAQAELSIELRYGDPQKALASALMPPGPGRDDYLALRMNPSNENVERFFVRAMRLDLTADQLAFGLQAFSEVGRPDKAYALLQKPGLISFPTRSAYILFRPHMRSFRADRRFMPFAKRLGLLDFWQSTAKWPVFCEDPRLPYDCKAEAARLSSLDHH